MILKFRKAMMSVSDTCTMIAVLAAIAPNLVIPRLGGGGTGWGPALTGLIVGGVIMAPITIPLLVTAGLCDLVGHTKPLREQDPKNDPNRYIKKQATK